MYDLINSNITQLLGTVDRSDVEPYLWMTRELHNRDVSQDQEFQREYCSCWALNGAGLGQPFRSAYFSLLERAKCAPERASVVGITWTLYEIPINAKEKKALQFSFASKLVHERRRRFQLPADYSGQKIIDTLIWKFVPFLESGALRDGSLVYR